jgi:hypothetical protein
MPALLELDHHENGHSDGHTACDGDCGCLCFSGMQAIPRVENHDIIVPVLRAVDGYVSPFIETYVVLLDRPPKLFS